MQHQRVQACDRTAVAVMSAVVLMLSSAAAMADPIADFYKGNTINLIVGSGTGGGYDISGRLIAEYLPRHIPGHPTIIVRNMAGASGMRAADYMYNVAAQDGTVLSVPQPTILLNKVLDPAARYEPQGYAWIGRLSALQTFGVVWHAAPIQSVEEARKRDVIMAAAQGPGTGSNVILALNQLVGTKFTLVKGYKSVSESSLAMERGEVQGISSTSWEILESKGWVASKSIRFLYVIGLVRNPKIPDTPTIGELGGNAADRDVLNAIASASEVGRVVMAPPNVPAERTAALRQAFAALLRDPDFIREAARRNIELDPLGGPELQALVARSMDITPAVAERTRRIIRP